MTEHQHQRNRKKIPLKIPFRTCYITI